MPDAKPQIKFAVEERKHIAWMSWNQSFACDVYKLIVIFAENMYKVKAFFFSKWRLFAVWRLLNFEL